MGKLHSRTVHTLNSAAFVLALSAAAWAQDGKPMTTAPGNTDTVNAWISGFSRMDYVHRPAAMTGFVSSESSSAGPNPAGARDENSFEGEMGVRFTAELPSKMNMIFEVGTRRTQGGTGATVGETLTRYGDGQAVRVDLREAAVSANLGADLKINLGITNYSFNPRGKGGSMAFDMRHSQTITRNLDSDGVALGRDDGFARLAEAAFVEEIMPVGASVVYSTGPCSITLVLLPAVIEGGTSRQDEQIYLIDGTYALDSLGKGSRAGLVLAYVTVPTAGTAQTAATNAKLIIVGGGTTLGVGGGLEVYVEGYAEIGRAGELLTGQRVAAGGRCGQIGAEWHYLAGNPLPFWAGLNFTMYSGDNSTSAGDRTAGRFAAYEGVNDLMILESLYYGFDWDSNYAAIKISGGLSLELLREKPDLDLSMIVGLTRASAKVNFPAPGTSPSNRLGNEIDVNATWHLNNQFALKVTLGYLWGSTILKNAMQGSGLAGPADHPTSNAFMFVLGWDLNF